MNEAERLVRKFFDEAINRGDLDAFDAVCSPDYVWHGGSDPEQLGDVHGLDAFKEAVAAFFRGFPDLEVTIEDAIGEGDRVAVRFREVGTHNGEFVGIPATGRTVTFAGMGIYRVENGLLAEEWFVDDSRAILEQLGAKLVPPSADSREE